MMSRTVFLLAFTFASGHMFAQIRDSVLVARVAELAQAKDDSAKLKCSKALEQELRSALAAPDAMTHDFNALRISRVDAPDGKFRLFTWNIPWADGTHRFEGLMLVKDKRGGAVVGLKDATSPTSVPEFATLGPDKWYGALYYDVVPVKKGGKVLYTLLGWKGFSKVETRKVVEVLTFKGTTPRFGSDVFDGLDAKGKPWRVRKSRLVYGFNFEVKMSLKWAAQEGMIVMDHLSPSRQDLSGQWSFYGPDLSYDGYRWEKNRWMYVRDIDARQKDGGNVPWNRPPRQP